MSLRSTTMYVLACLASALMLAPLAAHAADDAISQIVARKVLRVGVADYPPFVGKNAETGELEGFEIDSARMLAEEMGVGVEFVEMTWSTIVAGLQAGRYDVAMSGMGRSIQRAMAVDFTDPHVSLVDVAMVRSDKNIDSWEDVAKGTGAVAAVLGGLPYLKADLAKDQLGTAPLTPFKELAVAGNAVMAGQAVAWIEDVVSIGNFMNAHPDVPLKTISVPFLGRGAGNGYAVRRGETGLLNILNIFVYKMQDSGEFRRLAAKWKLPEQIIIPGRLEGK